MREPTKQEIQRLREIENQGAWNLPHEALRKALPCDGCRRMPLVNPKWLVEGNDRFWGPKGKYALGCPSGLWGITSFETLMEAIDNWNYHVELGGHYCGK